MSRDIYTIAVGNFNDKYICIAEDGDGRTFQRVRKPETKIDGQRLPEIIHVIPFAKSPISNLSPEPLNKDK